MAVPAACLTVVPPGLDECAAAATSAAPIPLPSSDNSSFTCPPADTTDAQRQVGYRRTVLEVRGARTRTCKLVLKDPRGTELRVLL